MARRGGNSTQRQVPQPVPNGNTNGLPPPSTIPAQIVHNAANARAQNTTNKRPFIEQVKDFLRKPELEDPDPVCNALVVLIVEGGIDPFFKEDPFALNHLKEQALHCLDALKIIFRQKPHLLLAAVHNEDDEGSRQPPIIVWLCSKLLGLLVREDLSTVHAQVEGLLGTCLEVFARSTSRVRQARTILKLYRSCVEDIALTLQPDEEEPGMPSQSFTVVLPNSSVIGELWPDSQQFVALPQGLQRTFASPVLAISIAFRLLQVISQSSTLLGSPSSISANDHLLPWALDSALGLWQDFKNRAVVDEKASINEEIESIYMQLLDAIALPKLRNQDEFSSPPKAALSITQGLLDLIKSNLSSPFIERNQIQLALLLTRLRSVIEEPAQGFSADGHRTKLASIIMDSMEPEIADSCRDVLKMMALHRDLQLAICLWTSPSDWPEEISTLRAALCTDPSGSFSTDELNQEFSSIVKTFRQMNLVEDERPSKRRRTLPESHDDDQPNLYNRIVMALTSSSPDSPMLDLSALHETVQARYADMHEQPADTEQEQCELLSAFGKIACAGSQCLQPFGVDRESWKDTHCTLCDATAPPQKHVNIYWDKAVSNEAWKDVVAAMLAITQEEYFQKCSKPRVMMAVAIGRLFSHISDPDYLNLEMCSLGQWLLKAMTRSLRELRIAASGSLMAFLRNEISVSVRDKNRRATMQFFAELTKRNSPFLQETLIMAYGQAARVCGEVELHIILGQLVEYLGHTSNVIYGAAYNELSSLADDFKMHPEELLRPYWRTIGFSIVNEVHSRPQKAQFVASLIGHTVDGLLLNIHGSVLPVLILNKRKDIVQRIAKARKTTVEDVCSQPRENLARVLALLLCQTGQDVERRAMDTLSEVAPGFRQTGQELHDLVKLESASVACEILELAADRDEKDREPFRAGIYRLAALDDLGTDGKDRQRKSAPKKKKSVLLDLFIRRHVLGIMAQFSKIIENPSGSHPLAERRRCVGAIREMVSLAAADSGEALPQLRACLQSAMADTNLCDHAFDVWSALLMVLDQKDLELVVDQTFALVVQHWPTFSDETHLKANKTFEFLRRNHNSTLQERIGYIPSLASIPMMSKLEAEIARLKAKMDPVVLLSLFSQRCNDENAVVVRQALKELVPFLEQHQSILHQSAISQKPLPALTALTRALLDICVRLAEKDADILILCAQCLGLIGGLDPYRVETVREKKRILVLQNFKSAIEVIDFAAFMLEEILVKVFLYTTNANSQGYLAFLMQELCKFCNFSNDVVAARPRMSQPNPSMQRWDAMPESVRNMLSPFLNSKYVIRGNPSIPEEQYPIFNLGISHATWLRTFVYDLLYKAKEENARVIFTVIARVVRHQDLSISQFILPFAVLNVILDGDDGDVNNIGRELLTILETEVQEVDHVEAANVKQCSENVFQVLDYLVLWLQEKKKAMSETRLVAGKTGRGISEKEEMDYLKETSAVERLLQLIPARVISRRAVECGSYARALFHWEQYYREEQTKAENAERYFDNDGLLQHLQLIYAQIDEPDSIEGISAHLQVLNPQQQIMEHRKAGRWTAAQSWYELALAEKPNDPDTQTDLLICLKESGQYDAILNHVDGFHASDSISASTLPFAVEAAWSTGKWDQLTKLLAFPSEHTTAISSDFNVGVGKALLALRNRKEEEFMQITEELRSVLAKGLNASTTASLHASHDHLVKLHTLYELEAISGVSTYTTTDREFVLDNLDRRLDILGVYTSDKQFLLGIRRAAMQLSSIGFTNLDIASAWLTTATLARKGDYTPAAFNSILHATQLGDDASKIEYSKMLWKEGHQRKAIQHLRRAIASNSFQARDVVPIDVSVSVSTTTTTSTTDNPLQNPNRVKAHAQLLLAKWLDRGGQTHSTTLKEEYAKGIMTYPKWDKGHYYLGRYYLKLYETEKTLPLAKQAGNFVAGELTKLVIENYIRSTVYGSKHYYQTIPKILTLWLDMGMEVINTQPRLPKDKDLYQHKLTHLEHINKYIKRYASERMPAYPWYTAFSQILSRISHPNKNVWDVLALIILKVAGQYPQQSLWSLLAVIHSAQDDRRVRGTQVLQKLRDHKRKNSAQELKNLILHGQRLTDALLEACDTPIEQRVSHVSLSRDLRFNMKLAPCSLVVPVEATMTPTLPSSNDSRMIRAHNPFPQDTITIAEFKDEVLVMSSLQRPRKIVVLGSDGRSYGLLCKPKDDLRKDQRLMEFNAMINRALQRDIESSKRRLYIRTNAVTPLNEECGTIEWVEGLKPMRDIIIRLYRQKNISIDYAEIRMLLNEACSDPAKTPIFTDRVLKRFPPVLHEWFVEMFPEPEAWFAARLRYTRSCAVMSIVGHVLGLGDRHGENVLLEEGNGGTFHVDFNCLFDKGLTFEKPELVPFRLTHNMVDAMGPQSIEGPFRKSAEITYDLLRQNADTLLTILETFVHDPTADFLSSRKKKRIPGVPETPQEVLEIVKSKLGGFIRGESVGLGVEGYVDSLVNQARDPRNLAAMYIGWCAFF